jgi:type IV secretory pathway VirB2 component (pilin)
MKKIITTILMSTIPGLVYAQENPPKINELFDSVDKIMGYLLPIAGLIAVIFVVIGGYMWMVSAGDPSRTKQAQGTLTWALLGLLFILVIGGILEIVLNLLS